MYHQPSKKEAGPASKEFLVNLKDDSIQNDTYYWRLAVRTGIH